MASELQILDLRNALLIRSKRRHIIAAAIISALIAATVVGFGGRHFLPWPVLDLVAVLAAAIDFLCVLRTKSAELRVTNLEFVLRSYFGGGYRSTRSVSRADIKWLEYQEDTTSPETAHHPGGLYAVLKHSNVCVLPFVDEHQAAVVIDRILEKFPDFRNQWEGQSPFGQHFTTLDLDRPTRRQKA